MKKHLVFVGGGHAHMTCLKELRSFVKKGHRVTLISPSDYHYYSGMGPGMLAGIYRPQQIRFHIKKMVQEGGGTFIPGSVTRLDPDRRILFLKSGDEILYDVASFNTGSSVPLGHVQIDPPDKVFTVKPIVNLIQAQRLILNLIREKKARILVAGGGPAGVEVSGNAWRLVRDNGGECKLTILPGTRLLGKFPDKVSRLASQSFKARGIEILEGPHVKRIKQGLAILDNDLELEFDVAFLALGVRPSRIFLDSGLPTGADGGLLMNKYLQSTAYSDIFGGGDCISFEDDPLDKVGVYAVRENLILYHNLMAALEGDQLRPFNPGDVYLLIFNLGDGKGIYLRKNRIFDGRLAFLLKDYIDRRFMRRFQVCGEQKVKGEENGKDEKVVQDR